MNQIMGIARMKHRTFITIDEQGWYFHFHTVYRGWLYRPSDWVLRLLKRSKYISAINTFSVSDGDKVHELHKWRESD